MPTLFWLITMCSLAVWASISTRDIPVSETEHILGVVSIVILLLVAIVSVQVLRKWALIRAVAKCLPLEMIRCEPTEPEDRWRATDEILKRFGITGQATVKLAGRGLNIDSGGPKHFFQGGEYVAEHKRAEDRSYVMRRQVARLWFDAFESLIGETKSIDVAVAKAAQALEHCYEESRITRRERINLSRLPNLANALGLPYDASSSDFKKNMEQATSSWRPWSTLILWLAINLFDYHQYLRYGAVVTGQDGRDRWVEFQGREAFEVMRMYQAWNGLRINAYLSAH